MVVAEIFEDFTITALALEYLDGGKLAVLKLIVTSGSVYFHIAEESKVKMAKSSRNIFWKTKQFLDKYLWKKTASKVFFVLFWFNGSSRQRQLQNAFMIMD